MMKQKRFLYPLIVLLTLLAGCQPNPSGIPGSHRAASVNTPPPPPPSASAVPGESAVPYDPDHPLGQWQSDGYFRDAQVIIPNVEKFPILLAEPARLDWEKMKAFAFDNVPERTEFIECGNDVDTPPNDMAHFIYTPGYGTELGEEKTGISKQLSHDSYGYYRTFTELYHRFNCVPGETDDRQIEVLELARSISEIRYSPEEAARMVEEVLRDWGVDTSSLLLEPIMMHDSLPYYYLSNEGEGDNLTNLRLWDKEPNYYLTYRHAPYGIPVFDGFYNDFKRIPGQVHLQSGDVILAAVNDLGIRDLNIRYHSIIGVEQNDTLIVPLEEIITTHSSAIKARVTGPIARIELFYIPVSSGDILFPNMRLVPTWGFFSRRYTSAPFILIDATTGLPFE